MADKKTEEAVRRALKDTRRERIRARQSYPGEVNDPGENNIEVIQRRYNGVRRFGPPHPGERDKSKDR